MPGILVVAETFDGGLAPISGELLGAARSLADAGAGTVSAFVAGDGVSDALISLGADAVYAGTAPALASGVAAAAVPAVNAAIQQSGANIVLLGQTSLGRDLGPALAFSNKHGHRDGLCVAGNGGQPPEGGAVGLRWQCTGRAHLEGRPPDRHREGEAVRRPGA